MTFVAVIIIAKWQVSTLFTSDSMIVCRLRHSRSGEKSVNFLNLKMLGTQCQSWEMIVVVVSRMSGQFVAKLAVEIWTLHDSVQRS